MFLRKFFLLIITTIVIIMSFYDITKSQKRFLMVSYNVIKKIDNQDFAQLRKTQNLDYLKNNNCSCYLLRKNGRFGQSRCWICSSMTIFHRCIAVMNWWKLSMARFHRITVVGNYPSGGKLLLPRESVEKVNSTKFGGKN